jgi:3-hydroxy-9,10-secoandrosta-1,3,5(10)-triene-9,17-dione monooxygenase reductase component
LTESDSHVAAARAADQEHYRRILGHFPTGVVVVTAVSTDGAPAGMSVGSFTSVSLEPPLVAFFPARSSTSWPRIEEAGSFCANILTAEQEHICQALARPGGDKFEGLGWRPAVKSGSPVLDGVAGWVDCDIDNVIEAGDHYIVVGRVLDLDAEVPDRPLVFYRGGYGAFAPRDLSR